MKTSNATVPTTKYIIIDSPSTTQPNSISNTPILPTFIKNSFTTPLVMCKYISAALYKNITPIVVRATSAPFKGKYLPVKVMTNAATKGSTTNNQAYSAKIPPSV